MHFTKAEIVVGVTKSGNALWRVAELAQGHAVTHTDRTQMQTSRTLNVAAPHLRVNPPIHIRPLTLYEKKLMRKKLALLMLVAAILGATCQEHEACDGMRGYAGTCACPGC